VRRRIRRSLEERLFDSPRLLGRAMSPNFSGLHRYRVVDYRIICEIEDHRLVIVVIKIGHRREVYR
jgi:mRNA interferase RelE/StbE